ASGDAYYCFCTKERLESLKTEDGYAFYDKHCLSLGPEEIEANLAAGMPYVIRLNVPSEGTTTFHDEIYGDITVDNSELDDMILIKSDGFPTYNFANVVDDHLMGITHVVRGNEYLSSSPKYNRIYDAFGWEVPVYVHCPLITDEKHAKLSKRSGHSSFEDLLDMGFLPEAIVNYTALLGWNPEDNEEIMSMEDLIAKFNYTKINKSPAVFDMGKLRWMNGEYIKRLPEDKFYEMALPFIEKAVPDRSIDRRVLAQLAQSRIETFEDIEELLGFLNEVPEYDISMYTHRKMKTTPELSLEVLREALPFLAGLTDYTNDALFTAIKTFAEDHGWKNGQVMWPLRTALSGKETTPGGATQLLELLGRDESLGRIEAAIEKLNTIWTGNTIFYE
ncbi:MAG: glutamate--tRNA ligase, partial [Lachnospiraceae bacterium]|nr:glutamate--tRNA ligase [Lachnospiraceae bacterium]